MPRYYLFSILALLATAGTAQPAPYSDESGFQRRIAGILPRLAGDNWRPRAMAPSRCPDTEMKVYTWALEGETIRSPYTGRSYRQPATGYFGPKARDAAGNLIAFGGDGLKYNLPPITACFLMDGNDTDGRAYLGIPGVLKQQYHFAAVNWARFYPLLAGRMSAQWQRNFARRVAEYHEIIRSDNAGSTGDTLTYPHDLVGQAGQLLGGNDIDGGTENHKVMWRTSALVYAQRLLAGDTISGYPTVTAEALLKSSLTDFARKLTHFGNGEYDSSLYYPYIIDGFLNLYDFTTDPATKEMARFVLDYYFTTLALKSFDGRLAGAQKRGYLPGKSPDRMAALLAAYFGEGTDPTATAGSLHLATTTYRPNALITRLGRGDVPLPYSVRVSRPTYHLDRSNSFQESFYRAPNFALGNVRQTLMDNPNQQLVWSLLVRGDTGPLGFTGGQPRRLTTSGHSPYTQTVHHENTLLLLSAGTDFSRTSPPPLVVDSIRVNPWYLADSINPPQAEAIHRGHFGAARLREVVRPDVDSATELDRFWREKTDAAASWLLIPRGVTEVTGFADRRVFRSQECWISVLPLGEENYLLEVTDSVREKLSDGKWKKLLADYRILVCSGSVSGYALEVIDRAVYPSVGQLKTALQTTRIRRRDYRLQYTNLSGNRLRMDYRPDALSAEAWVNGDRLNYTNWTDGLVYRSPILNTGKGRFQLSLPGRSWLLDYRSEQPVSVMSTLPTPPAEWQ